MDLQLSPEDRLAPGPKPSNTPMIIATLVVCAILGVVGWKLHKKDLEKTRQIESLARLNAELQRQEDQWRAEEEARQKKVERTLHYDQLNQQNLKRAEKPIGVIQAEQTSAQPGKKQTVYNERNYVARGADNSIPPPPRRYQQPSRQTQARSQNVLQMWAPWSWESINAGNRGRKTRIGGQFSYLVQNDIVNTSSVCANEGPGSIRYRDCRKAAKKYFEKQCRAGDRAACSAQHLAP